MDTTYNAHPLGYHVSAWLTRRLRPATQILMLGFLLAIDTGQGGVIAVAIAEQVASQGVRHLAILPSLDDVAALVRRLWSICRDRRPQAIGKGCRVTLS